MKILKTTYLRMFHVKPYKSIALIIFTILINSLAAQTVPNKFQQLDYLLPTPNYYRTASGQPGEGYWQQQANYKINITLNEKNQSIVGAETITYFNHSPDALEYLWVQLDQNVRQKKSDTYSTAISKMRPQMSIKELERLEPTFDGGFNIEKVTDITGKSFDYTIVKTMMRINLDKPLKQGEKIDINIKWWYNINNRLEDGGRSGYEFFPDENNYIFTIAQFFPRMAVYIDNEGWQNKQFLGKGEFTLPFGDYEVTITVPKDHLVSATGTLQNPDQVLTKNQLSRLKKAEQSYEHPIMIVTEEEAKQNEKKISNDTKTWQFKATNVRDFAFASSRKFIWDAMAVQQSDNSIVMAMSMYPKEGNPLWEQYSTKTIAHTIKWYSHYTFPYPYPVAWSIHTDRIGMEYPMICFNGGRPEKDGTYSERTKYGMISVIIHEVGHNYFPMIVNSDERQWTWMDEGLNSYLQYLTEQQWERNYPSRRGPAENIVNYMAGNPETMSPIMSNSESVWQLGNNAYGKPATALNILRETIVGRKDFDYAFKIYANRWKFKHPSPADFFRTIEDATAIDLDWFWRGWFFTTEPVDLSIESATEYKFTSLDLEEGKQNKQNKNNIQNIGQQRNALEIEKTQDEIDTTLRDFYTTYNPFDYDKIDLINNEEIKRGLSQDENKFLAEPHYYYELTIANKGGTLMPIILEFTFEDEEKIINKIPAEIWRLNNKEVTKVFHFDKQVKQIILDPLLETADIDRTNNYYPNTIPLNQFEIFKKKRNNLNPMQRNSQIQNIDNQ
jgi:hypothetical protein